VLDLWFERVVKKSCRGEACRIRYADDYVCAFEAKEEAERFYGALENRLGKFGLELSEQKTRIITFSQYSRSYNWTGFKELLEHFKVPRPRIVARPRPKLAASLS